MDIEKRVGLAASLFSVGAMLIGAVVYFARLEPATQANTAAISDLKLSQAETRADFQRDQQKQNDRVDRIEESRTMNLQRLSKVEEAVAATKDSLASINARLDRALLRR